MSESLPNGGYGGVPAEEYSVVEWVADQAAGTAPTGPEDMSHPLHLLSGTDHNEEQVDPFFTDEMADPQITGAAATGGTVSYPWVGEFGERFYDRRQPGTEA